MIDDNGSVIATGCNDAPAFGGGLYTAESGENDKRCFNNGGKCLNDTHKEKLKKEITQILRENDISTQKVDVIADQIAQNTKVKHIIEYSRAVHAEMDAILSIARTSNVSTKGSTLYCTTYPCHNCTKHIIATGIERVIYMEPYEKSLATALHDDAICHSDKQTISGKVCFEHFEGVSPRRYHTFFGYNLPRKDESGEARIHANEELYHIDPIYLDSYTKYEEKALENVKKKLPGYT